MNIHMENEKSCDPQLFGGAPLDDWGLDQAGSYGRAQQNAIAEGERLLSANYWRLGLALNLSRRHCSRDQGARFLAALGVDETRASKSCSIHRTFKTEESAEGLSAQEA